MADTTARFSADPLPPGIRIACRIEYDGARYHGWQSQSHHDPARTDVATIQDSLEQALAVVANAPVRIHCAGRTDAGVHAFSQIVHFDTPSARSRKAWVLGTNANLPADIRVHWAQPVAADFHARFSATARRYRYLIANTPVRPALHTGTLGWQRLPLDVEKMHLAAQALLGEQDFSAFRAASCQSNSPHRNVHAVSVTGRGPLIMIDITANAFLHHMVRNIVGSLVAVGCLRQSPGWIAELLARKDRTRAAETATADGLYLVEVIYPRVFKLPPTPPGPLIVAN